MHEGQNPIHILNPRTHHVMLFIIPFVYEYTCTATRWYMHIVVLKPESSLVIRVCDCLACSNKHCLNLLILNKSKKGKKIKIKESVPEPREKQAKLVELAWTWCKEKTDISMQIGAAKLPLGTMIHDVLHVLHILIHILHEMGNQKLRWTMMISVF